MRLGRQKWRLKGKIETDDSQTWDEEEKIFIPNLHEKFEIKVWCIMVGLESGVCCYFSLRLPRVSQYT